MKWGKGRRFVWPYPLNHEWQAELAYKVGHEEGHRTDQGIFARVSWKTSLREVLNHASAFKEKALGSGAAGSP